MSEALYFSEHTLQEVALVFMGLVYITRLIWLFRFPAVRERQAPTGLPGTTRARGILYSWFNVAMPWAMESSRQNLFLWVQFVVFHLGVVAAIALSFVIPYAPGLLQSSLVVLATQAVVGAAFVVACMRIIRRVGNKYMRAISSPDDYFSLLLLTVWFAFAFLATLNRMDAGEWHLLTYFILTAFFLVYVPFSKISHYLYYPFTRYWLGKTLGYRGIYPIKRGPKPSGAAIQPGG
jgi:nitrate reductase gamma subunit